MRVIIPSKDRADIISSHLLFPEYTVVLHNEEQKSMYLKNETINPENIVVSGVGGGVSLQRQWIIENLIEPNEWFIAIDDNVQRLTGVVGEDYEKNILFGATRETFENEIDATRFLEIVSEMLEEAERVGAKYCGFAVVDNYYFRKKKFRYVGYVISKLALIKNAGIKYDPKIQAMDDYGFTADNLLKYGKVLINNYVYPVAKHYQKGGIGTYEERVEKKIADCEYLMEKYPGLFRYKKKKDRHPKAELQVKFTNTDQVSKWRRNLVFGKSIN